MFSIPNYMIIIVNRELENPLTFKDLTRIPVKQISQVNVSQASNALGMNIRLKAKRIAKHSYSEHIHAK